MGPRRSPRARREGVRRELRRLPSGERHGRPARVPRARRLEDGERTAGRADRDGAERQAGDCDAGLRQDAVRHRHRRRDHLHAERLDEQGGRQSRPAGRGEVGAQVTNPDAGGSQMSAVIDDHGHGHEDHAHHPGGIMRWISPTNHQAIGTLYLWFSGIMSLVGGVLALGIRAELFVPGLQVWNPEFFNQLTTMHGLIMVFGAIMPAFVGFANWQVPMMIGAPDMAFARMNNWSFWLLPFAATLLVVSFFVPGGATGAGWTLYAPLTVQMGPGMDLAIFALHIMGASSIMGSINIITTILNMRAPGMTMMKIDRKSVV